MRLRFEVRKVKEMVEKELLVTIVFDCCFSSGMVRNHDSDDFNIRHLEWDAIIHHSPEHGSESMHSPCSDTFRDGFTKLTWLVEPKETWTLRHAHQRNVRLSSNLKARSIGCLRTFFLRLSDIYTITTSMLRIVLFMSI